MLCTDLFSVVSARIGSWSLRGRPGWPQPGSPHGRQRSSRSWLWADQPGDRWARLFISVRTVECHVSSLLRKLGLAGAARADPAGPAASRRAGAADAVDQLFSSACVGRTCAATRALAACLCPGVPGRTGLLRQEPRAGAGGRPPMGGRDQGRRDWPPQRRRDVSAIIATALGLSHEADDLAMAARVALAGRSLLLGRRRLRSGDRRHGQATHRARPGGAGSARRGHQPAAAGRQRGAGPAGAAAGLPGRLRTRHGPGVRSRAAVPGPGPGGVAAVPSRRRRRTVRHLPSPRRIAAWRSSWPPVCRTLDLATLADGLTSQLRLLERPAGSGQHRSLAAAIEWSWQLLDPGEGDLLGHLAALRADFTLAMAEAVAPARAAADAEANLLRLADRSLVERDAGRGAARAVPAAGHHPLLRGRAVGRGHRVRAARARPVLLRAPPWRRSGRAASPGRCRRSAPAFDEANHLAALTWAAARRSLADRLLRCVAQLIGMQPSRRGIEVISAVAGSDDVGWSSEALAWASWASTYLNLGAARDLAVRSAARAAGNRDQAYARWAAALGARLPSSGGGGARLPGRGHRLRAGCSRNVAGSLRLAGPRPGPQPDGGRLPRLSAGGHPVRGGRRPHARQQRAVHARAPGRRGWGTARRGSRSGWTTASRTRPATATATSWPISTTSGRSTSGCRGSAGGRT